MLAVEVSQPQPGLAEVVLVNRGDADGTSAPSTAPAGPGRAA